MEVSDEAQAAAPLALAVEFGRQLLPRADPAIGVRDFQNGKFIPTLRLQIQVSGRKTRKVIASISLISFAFYKPKFHFSKIARRTCI